VSAKPIPQVLDRKTERRVILSKSAKAVILEHLKNLAPSEGPEPKEPAYMPPSVNPNGYSKVSSTGLRLMCTRH